MTQTKKSALLFVLVLLLGGTATAVLWTLNGSGGSVAPAPVLTPESGHQLATGGLPSDPDDRESVLVATERPVFDDSKAGSTVVYPLEIELNLVKRARFVEVAGVRQVGSGANARIKGNIRNPRGEGLQATVTFGPGPNAGRVLRCDSTGAFGAADLYPGLSIVDVVSPGYRAQREVLLRTGSEALLNIGFGRAAAVYGEVVDRKGKPLEGVDVTFDGQESRTDHLGEFYFPGIAGGSRVLATFRKKGYASYRETLGITSGRTVAKGRLKYVLDEGATLDVVLESNVGNPRTPAKLYLMPVGAHRSNGSRGQRTYPWHLVSPIELRPGSMQRIEGLPDGQVLLVLYRPGAIATPKQVQIKLYRGKTSQQALKMDPAPQIRGRVLHAGGHPAAGARVVLEAPNRQRATEKQLSRSATFAEEMISPHVPASVQEVLSDAAGKFTFTAYPGMGKGLYLTAETQDGAWRGGKVVSPESTDIEVELERVSQQLGELIVGLSDRFQALPIRLRVKGAPRDPYDLGARDEDLVIKGLEIGTWRADITWNGKRLLQQATFEVSEHESGGLAVELPPGAINGQTAEERRRAGYSGYGG